MGGSRRRGEGAGLVAVGLAAALFALAGAVASRLFDAGVPPVELAEIRAAIALCGLLLLPAARRPPRTSPRPLLVAALGVSLAVVTLLYYVAIAHLPVTVAIVLQYSGPALVVAWVALVTRRRPPPRILASLAAALAGVVLVSELPLAGGISIDLVGLGAGLGSAVMFAAYTLLSERVEPVYGPGGTMLRGFAVATALWVLFQAPQGLPAAVFRVQHLPGVLFVGLGGTLAAFLLYVWGVARIRSERAAIAATLEPVLASLVAWTWLDQSLSPWQIAGGVLVVGAVMGLHPGGQKAAPGEEAAALAGDRLV
jgi:drug/metabolite transporter, DME family